MVDVFASGLHPALDIAMMVPSGVIELDKAHPAFGHASSHEAVGGKGSVGLVSDTIEFASGFRFTGEVSKIGDTGLHFVSEFILRKARHDLGIGNRFVVVLVQSGEGVEGGALSSF